MKVTRPWQHACIRHCKASVSSRKRTNRTRIKVAHVIVYSYFMPVCSIVKTITPRCRGGPDALLREAEGRVQ